MRKIICSLVLVLFYGITAKLQSIFNGNVFFAPEPSLERVDDFANFTDKELALDGINTLILRGDFNNDYASRFRI